MHIPRRAVARAEVLDSDACTETLKEQWRALTVSSVTTRSAEGESRRTSASGPRGTRRVWAASWTSTIHPPADGTVAISNVPDDRCGPRWSTTWPTLSLSPALSAEPSKVASYSAASPPRTERRRPDLKPTWPAHRRPSWSWSCRGRGRGRNPGKPVHGTHLVGQRSIPREDAAPRTPRDVLRVVIDEIAVRDYDSIESQARMRWSDSRAACRSLQAKRYSGAGVRVVPHSERFEGGLTSQLTPDVASVEVLEHSTSKRVRLGRCSIATSHINRPPRTSTCELGRDGRGAASPRTRRSAARAVCARRRGKSRSRRPGRLAGRQRRGGGGSCLAQ